MAFFVNFGAPKKSQKQSEEQTPKAHLKTTDPKLSGGPSKKAGPKRGSIQTPKTLRVKGKRGPSEASKWPFQTLKTLRFKGKLAIFEAKNAVAVNLGKHSVGLSYLKRGPQIG